ncbi:hypothetical protein D3C86_2237100 [compost metagenome]
MPASIRLRATDVRKFMDDIVFPDPGAPANTSIGDYPGGPGLLTEDAAEQAHVVGVITP